MPREIKGQKSFVQVLSVRKGVHWVDVLLDEERVGRCWLCRRLCGDGRIFFLPSSSLLLL